MLMAPRGGIILFLPTDLSSCTTIRPQCLFVHRKKLNLIGGSPSLLRVNPFHFGHYLPSSGQHYAEDNVFHGPISRLTFQSKLMFSGHLNNNMAFLETESKRKQGIYYFYYIITVIIIIITREKWSTDNVSVCNTHAQLKCKLACALTYTDLAINYSYYMHSHCLSLINFKTQEHLSQLYFKHVQSSQVCIDVFCVFNPRGCKNFKACK